MVKQDFIEQRAQQLVQNRQEQITQSYNKQQHKEGFDIMRLVHPPLEQLNDDFLCAIC